MTPKNGSDRLGIELGNCAEHGPPFSEDECKAACLDNPECGAFNLPNGHLKAMDCTSGWRDDGIEAGSSQDLYWLEQEPQRRPANISLTFGDAPQTDCLGGRELGNCSSYLPPPYTRSECEAAW
jgi:hypothetical protein